MAIDLNACTGCNACVVACQSENNIPVVGKEQVADRPRDALDPHRPLLRAAISTRRASATSRCCACSARTRPARWSARWRRPTHSAEGLNDMVYNRCVGTRYCSNNCPYKVRRFNFLHWNGNTYNDAQSHPVLELMQQPRRHGAQPRRDGEVHLLRAAHQSGEDRRRARGPQGARRRDPDRLPAGLPVAGHRLRRPQRRRRPRCRAGRASRATTACSRSCNTRPRTTYLARITQPEPELWTASAPASTASHAVRDHEGSRRSTPRSVPPKPPFIAPGHTPGTVTDQIASVVTPARRRAGGSSASASPSCCVMMLFDAISKLFVKGIGIWGNNVPVGLGVRHHQLRLVDRHRPRRHADLGDPAPAAAALAHLDQPLRRGDDALRRGLRRTLPAAPRRPAVARLLAAAATPTRWACGRNFRSPLIWDVFAVSTYATVSLLFWYVGLIPDLATLRDQAKNKPARADLRHAGDGLARLGAATGTTTRPPTCCSPASRRRWCSRCTPWCPSTSRPASCPAGTPRSSRPTSWPARSSPASRWCSRSRSRCAAPSVSTTSSPSATSQNMAKVMLATGLIVGLRLRRRDLHRPGTAATSTKSSWS